MTGFQETQRPRQLWIWVIIVGLAAVFWYGLITQVVVGRPWGSQPAPDAVVIACWAFAGLLLPGLLLLTRLRTRVDRHGVHVRFEPFHLRWRSWAFEEIREAAPRTFSPLGEFGGWGIRRGRNGSVYTMAGDIGVELRLTDDTRVLIGTRDAAGFVRVVDAGRAGAAG